MTKYDVTHWLALPLRVRNIEEGDPVDAAIHNKKIEEVLSSHEFQALRYQGNLMLRRFGVKWLDWDDIESVYILVDELDENGETIYPMFEHEHWFTSRGNKQNWVGDAGNVATMASTVIQTTLALLDIDDIESAQVILAQWLKTHTVPSQIHVSWERVEELLRQAEEKVGG
jgi:hypothetical protein